MFQCRKFLHADKTEGECTEAYCKRCPEYKQRGTPIPAEPALPPAPKPPPRNATATIVFAGPPSNPFPIPPVRNLLYHVYPVAGNGIWQWNVEQILKRINAFTGRRVVGVVTDSGCDPVEKVMEAFKGEVTEWVVLPNDPTLREVVTWLPLWEKLIHAGLEDTTFCFHAKGVTRGNHTTCVRWAEMTYELCLDYLPLVDEALARYPLTGPFKLDAIGWRRKSASNWHYSGTGFWVRNAALLKRAWRNVDQFYGGTEAWVGTHFASSEGHCLFREWDTLHRGMYDPAFLAETEMLLDQWKTANAHWRSDYATKKTLPPQVEKLEIGGGIYPREGFTNLDQVPNADIHFDLDSIPGQTLPLPDESVGEVYSSHCFEHLKDPIAVMREVARVCRVGARVEIRVPHWLSDIAFSPGHLSILSQTVVRNVCHFFTKQHWGGRPRRLKLVDETYSKSGFFGEVRNLHPEWTEEQVLKFAPGAAHDVRYIFEVVAYHDELGEAEAPGGSHYGRSKA